VPEGDVNRYIPQDDRSTRQIYNLDERSTQVNIINLSNHASSAAPHLYYDEEFLSPSSDSEESDSDKGFLSPISNQNVDETTPLNRVRSRKNHREKQCSSSSESEAEDY